MSDVEMGESQDGLLPITCRDCGRIVRIGLPVGLSDFDAMTKAFERRHEACGAFRLGAEQMRAETVKMLRAHYEEECAFEVEALPLPVLPKGVLV